MEDVATGEVSRSAALTVIPELRIDPVEGLSGDELTLEETGFDDREQYNVTLWNATVSSMVVDLGHNEETDDYGSFTVTFTIPEEWDYGAYGVNVSDGTNINISTSFTIKSSIKLTLDRGPEGSVVSITGRGFTPNQLLSQGTVSWNGPPGVAGYPLSWVNDPIINGSGEFTGEIVAPSWGLGSWRVQVFDENIWAEDNFTINGIASISINPTYGVPGIRITVNGINFPQFAGTEIRLDLNGTALGEVDTNADGTWNTTFTVPAVQFGHYLVNATTAYWSNYHVNATTEFMLGTSFYLSSSEGSEGSEITISGAGYSPGYFNLTLGESQIITNGVVSEYGNFSTTFIVPAMNYSTFLINVTDEYHGFTLPFTVIPNRWNISITSPNLVTIGSIVEIHGTLYWDNGTRLSDTLLLVQYIPGLSTRANYLSTLQTDVNGSFQMQWIPPTTGDHIIQFDWVDGSNNWVNSNWTRVSLGVNDAGDDDDQLILSAGWNMVSSFDRVVPADEVFPDYYQLVTWNGAGYVSVDVMEPGKGYWALVLEDTTIIITG